MHTNPDDRIPSFIFKQISFYVLPSSYSELSDVVRVNEGGQILLIFLIVQHPINIFPIRSIFSFLHKFL